MFRPKKKVIDGVEYMVLGSTHNYGQHGIVSSSYTTTTGRVVIEGGVVTHARMRIYQMNEDDYMAARSIVDAIRVYQRDYGDIENQSKVRMLSDEEMDVLIVNHCDNACPEESAEEEGLPKSFAEHLADRNLTEPELFASRLG